MNHHENVSNGIHATDMLHMCSQLSGIKDPHNHRMHTKNNSMPPNVFELNEIKVFFEAIEQLDMSLLLVTWADTGEDDCDEGMHPPSASVNVANRLFRTL